MTDMADRPAGVTSADNDERAIRAVLHRYALACDTADTSMLVNDVFAEDAVIDHGRGPVEGSEAITAMFQANFDRFEGTAHFITNVDIDLAGDRAHTSLYIMAWHWLRTTSGQGRLRPADFVLMARYLEVLERRPAGWRIAKRVMQQLGPGSFALGELPEWVRGYGGISS
jgi:ketosteroid isomerase-like protein